MHLQGLIFITILFKYVFCIRYDNHTLFRADIRNEEDAKFINKLTQMYKVNLWTEPVLQYKKTVDFSIGPEDKYKLLKNVVNAGLNVYPLMENIQIAFDHQTVKTYIRRKQESFDWNNYYRLDDIYAWMRDIAAAFPSEIVLESIGKSYKNRDILCLRMNLGGGQDKQKVVIEGGIHAREWISSAVATYMIYHVHNSKFSNNFLLKTIAYKYEWIFIPVTNPDGYEYTHEKDRLWRKNIRGSGVDLNRNFDVEFGKYVSKEESDESYPGLRPFSEPETMALSMFLQKNRNNLMFYFALHSYGQYMIIPYSFSKHHLDNYDEVYKIAERAAESISKEYKTMYKVGTTYDTVGYLASGASMCWVKRTLRVPVVLTIELRDTGFYGFALPPAQIAPTGEEMLLGIATMIHSSPDMNSSLGQFQEPQFRSSDARNIDDFRLNFFLVIIVFYSF